ncbi:hypothetical protein B0J14DRAFT_252275 [Halenospora varia]|nr:hypothetical protein B0J14DRAFT_252275 [Halenospora varia]
MTQRSFTPLSIFLMTLFSSITKFSSARILASLNPRHHNNPLRHSFLHLHHNNHNRPHQSPNNPPHGADSIQSTAAECSSNEDILLARLDPGTSSSTFALCSGMFHILSRVLRTSYLLQSLVTALYSQTGLVGSGMLMMVRKVKQLLSKRQTLVFDVNT